MVFHVAFVQPERKLIDVAGQMLGAGVVIDADQPALENGKKGVLFSEDACMDGAPIIEGSNA